MSGFGRRLLGRTHLDVFPLGLGGGGSISTDDTIYAVEKGINYLFFSSDLHHFAYQGLGRAIMQLCGKGARDRDSIVVATVSYVNDPEKLVAALYDQITELKLDYVDVFHWGWITDATDCARLLSSHRELTTDSITTTMIRTLVGMQARASEVSASLVTRGLARYVGASFHSRAKARAAIDLLDVLMVRYNIAHRGFEVDLAPALPASKADAPGIVAFNTAHEGGRPFHLRPSGYDPNWPVPSATDSYRFALSHPAVDLVLTGLRNRHEIDEAVQSMGRGPLSESQLRFMSRYGDLIRTRVDQHKARLLSAAHVP